MHGGGAKKGGSGTDEIVNKEPSKRGGAIGGKRGGKASGAPTCYLSMFCTLLTCCRCVSLHAKHVHATPRFSINLPPFVAASYILSAYCLLMLFTACCLLITCMFPLQQGSSAAHHLL